MPDRLVVATVNVNGIRAALRRGMDGWLAVAEPQVLLLQEVRAPTEVLGETLGDGWHIAHVAGQAAGRAGVAVASRFRITEVREGLPGLAAESAGRWVEADVALPDDGCLTAVSAYVHAATAQTPSMVTKLAFLDRIGTRMSELGGSSAVVGGDLNVAHDHRDLRNWRGNRGKSGFLPEEQAHLTAWLELGWVDAARSFAGDVEGPYTWWSWRGRAFDNDAGWRIDYLWCSPALAGALVDVTVDRAASYDARFSDHAPLRMTLDAPR